MIILTPLDYFDTKLYNKGGDTMKNFMNCDLKIKDITLACLVPPNGGTPVHKNTAHSKFIIARQTVHIKDF